MPYLVGSREHVDKIFFKLRKKSKAQLEVINKKIAEICEDPHRYKQLRQSLKGLYRVHFGSFVLTYSVDEAAHKIIIEDYDHHDNIY